MASGVPFGAYRLVRRLGEGGMAEVFLARREGPGGFEKNLVIKRILPHLARNAGFVEMFLKEARVAALIDHPNLVHVSDFGAIDGEYYLAMEYVDGFTLTEVVRRLATFTPGVATRVAVDVLEGLNAVHAARDPSGEHIGLVHRDVSPGNVMLTRDGAVKLLDFGIAAAKDDDTSSRMGTRRFMSPEQLAGSAQDARSDLFSVGVLLYALICGRMPYPNLPTDLPERPEEIPVDLWPTVQSALHPDADARPASARAMQAPLEMFLSSRGLEGTRSHLATVLQSVLPPSSPARRMVSRLTQQIGHVTRAVTGTFGTQSAASEAAEPDGTDVAATRALAAPADEAAAGGASRRALGVSLAVFALFALVAVGVLRRDQDTVRVQALNEAIELPLAAEPAAVTPRAPEAARAAVDAESPPEAPSVAGAAAASAAEPTTVTPRTAKKRRARRRTKAPRRVAATGRLTIDTRPWTEVYLGERRLGMTPLQGVELPSGRHRLRLENSKVGLETTLTVKIRPGRETRIRRAL